MQVAHRYYFKEHKEYVIMKYKLFVWYQGNIHGDCIRILLVLLLSTFQTTRPQTHTHTPSKQASESNKWARETIGTSVAFLIRHLITVRWRQIVSSRYRELQTVVPFTSARLLHASICLCVCSLLLHSEPLFRALERGCHVWFMGPGQSGPGYLLNRHWWASAATSRPNSRSISWNYIGYNIYNLGENI